MFFNLSLFFSLKNNDKKFNIFSLFAALATQIRIMGILLIIFYILFTFWEFLENKKNSKQSYLKTSYIIILYFIFLYLFWPFLWDNPISNLLETFFTFSNYDWGLKVFYLGNYLTADNLPWHYIPVWIIITTPITYLIFFSIGLYFILNVFF